MDSVELLLDVHAHGHGRRQRQHQPGDPADGRRRRQPGLHHHAGPGYHIADVLVDGGSVGAVSGYTFTNVTADHTIAASFALRSYTITASAGSRARSTRHAADRGLRRPTRPSRSRPATGYHVADVLVDDVLGRRGDELHVHQRAPPITRSPPVRDHDVHDHADGRAHGSHQPGRATDRGLRRQPDLHDHAGHRLPHRRRPGGRRLGRRGHEPHVHQRDRGPHDQRQLRDQTRTRSRRRPGSMGASARPRRRRSRSARARRSRSARRRGTTSPTSPSTGPRSAR